MSAPSNEDLLSKPLVVGIAGGRILVKRIVQEDYTETESGIAIKQFDEKNPCWFGRVESMDPETVVNYETVAGEQGRLKQGDVVIFSKFTGVAVVLGDGKDRLALDPAEVVGVVQLKGES